MSENIIDINGVSNNDNIMEIIEDKYPKCAAEFKKIQLEQYYTFCKKLHDYGPYNISLGREVKTKQDALTALTVICIRCTEKVQRLVNILFYTKDNEAHNEPLIDSFADISVYGIIAQIIHSGKWNK
jgi:hypothetical protein